MSHNRVVFRSLCTVFCKWTYTAEQSSAGNWDRSYFEQIGLGDLSENNWSIIGEILIRYWYWVFERFGYISFLY